ncbi:HAMP domain-containing protein [Peteryoungia desertarenae]|uniref:HAMP domain-containing protein n=1 Tax=Peteryoungia desertarenae TaxID=1813451 RepID=A0ABX6QQF6_9HYPH|nr:HAMP domain-containing methyl-accepting chemotaxis protein [Peteryoungia desertarenae]QLF70871.1 HAMP domain-containing protein [Peteryoungia desertarenae]
MSFSIRNVLIGVFALLSLLLSVLVAHSLLNSYRNYQVYAEVSELTGFDKALFEALLAFRSERGDSRSAIALGAAEGAGSVESMKKRRAAVDAGMNEAKAVAARLDATALGGPITSVMASYETILAFRKTIDEQLAKPPEARDPDLTRNWMSVGGAFLTELEKASLETEARMRMLEPSLTPMIQMRVFAWSTRATAGDALIILNNAATAGQPIDGALQQRLAVADATAAFAWGKVGVLVNHPDTPRPIKDAYEAAERSYFKGQFADMRADFVTKISSGENPPLTIDQWRAATTPAINSIAAVASLAMDTLNNDAKAAKASALGNMIWFLALFVLVLLLGAIGMMVILSKVIRPMGLLTNCMRTLASGNLSVVVPGAQRRDEMGEMARSVEVFQEAAKRNRELETAAEESRLANERERIEMQARAEAEAEARLTQATGTLAAGLKRLAAGDLMCEIDQQFAPQFEALRHDFNTSVRQLRAVLISVGGAASAVSGGSGEISSASGDLAKRTEQQAASLEQTAAALEQITANVTSTSRRSGEARDIVRNTRSRAEQSGVVVGNAVTAMERIEHASKQISQIIGVIDEIAFQTNLLALNAGVEAARAGEAGKGFAVVAQEVRELAQRSANAAKEIKSLISNSEIAVSEGVKLVNETGDGLTAIAGLVQAINEHMDAIASAAQEQSVGLGEVNTAVNHMDQSTQKNAAMVEEMNAASAGLAQEAANLAELLRQFRTGEGAAVASSPKATPAAAPVARQPAPAPSASRPRPAMPAVSGNTALARDNWEEF